MKALEIMRSVVPVDKKAETYALTIKRNLQKQIIDPLIDKKEKLEDDIESAMDFSLNVNINEGMSPITREQAEERFKRVQGLEYQLVMLNLEMKAKLEIFNRYFGDDEKAK